MAKDKQKPLSIIPHIDHGNHHNDYAPIDVAAPIVARGIVIAYNNADKPLAVLGTVYSDGSPAQEAIANKHTQEMLSAYNTKKLAEENAKILADNIVNQPATGVSSASVLSATTKSNSH
jgi:hypothetical protein